MNFLKKQGVAWVITIAMILIAIGIGRVGSSTPTPEPPSQTIAPIVSGDGSFYVYDDANVLTSKEEETLAQLNQKLLSGYDAVVACVTTNYGRSDLYNFALDYAERLNLTAYDFIVVLDISGENYWLVQGYGLVNQFTDEDCGNYAWNYMEDDFARGDYGDALISLVKALSEWYQSSKW